MAVMSLKWLHIARHDRVVNLITKDIQYLNILHRVSKLPCFNTVLKMFAHLSTNTPDVDVVNEGSKFQFSLMK